MAYVTKIKFVAPGLNRVAVAVHGLKLFSAKHGFSAEIQAIKNRIGALKMWGDGIDKFNIIKKSEKITNRKFISDNWKVF